ncbi:hypothetical protein SAMN05443244_3537 [Terriglobus roseus]|uniref:Uncharacterized protein n=1 Tax=Terriglobus roseus TaxID=392734 RepID=A0A1H4SSL9_9BACT|nr:hypothetical protein SAMN05443244_3537 [Terriglobus roseus]
MWVPILAQQGWGITRSMTVRLQQQRRASARYPTFRFAKEWGTRSLLLSSHRRVRNPTLLQHRSNDRITTRPRAIELSRIGGVAA